MKKAILTPSMRKTLEDLWFVWGNNGPKSTHANHRFIQCILERGEYNADFFKPDEVLIRIVDRIINNETF